MPPPPGRMTSGKPPRTPSEVRAWQAAVRRRSAAWAAADIAAGRRPASKPPVSNILDGGGDGDVGLDELFDEEASSSFKHLAAIPPWRPRWHRSEDAMAAAPAPAPAAAAAASSSSSSSAP